MVTHAGRQVRAYSKSIPNCETHRIRATMAFWRKCRYDVTKTVKDDFTVITAVKRIWQ